MLLRGYDRARLLRGPAQYGVGSGQQFAHVQSLQDGFIGAGEKLYRAMCEAGQEGIISKQADAPYRGARTKAWLKVKCTRRQEFVIIGWTESDKKSRAFRSLLLGLNENGKLRYAGKVGTGFSMATQQELSARLRRLERKVPDAQREGVLRRPGGPVAEAEVLDAQGGGHGGSHPHLAHNFLMACLGRQPAMPDAETSDTTSAVEAVPPSGEGDDG